MEENEVKKGIILIKPIPEFERYSVDETGNIYDEKLKKLAQSGSPYKRVALHREDGSIARPTVHRCVANAFLSDSYQPNYQVFHLDGDQYNNRVDNLAWKSPKEISEYTDKVLHKIYHGVENPAAKPIVALDPTTKELVYEFNSLMDAARYLLQTDKFIELQRASNSISAAKKSKRAWHNLIWLDRKEYLEENGR